MVEALDIHVKGIVQGVGFRPFVYRQAKKHLVNGWVLNAADGVHIHAEAEQPLLDEFVMAVADEAPAAARVEELEMHEVPLEGFDTFEIRFSDDAPAEEHTLVSPDLATCADCERELFDPEDRRFRYPFINCTNCGPRFTIIDSLPYDRKATSMRDFPMCKECDAEYSDASDRRFHAQPNACFECGPKIYLATREGQGVEAPSREAKDREATNPDFSQKIEDAASKSGLSLEWGSSREESDACFAAAARMLCDGKILAVKGLGGFHLVCDANNADAIARLRERKHREGRPLAVMAASLQDVRKVCETRLTEEAVLAGSQRPIVLLKKHADAKFAAGLADELPELGVMLPYTPVQHILLHDFSKLSQGETSPSGIPLLVMTSGNIHDEPIVINDLHAFCELADVADAFLGNNREIRTRFDDSVVRIIGVGGGEAALQFIRRARGYSPAPLSVALSSAGENAHANACIFATGPEQKNTFTFLRTKGDANGADASNDAGGSNAGLPTKPDDAPEISHLAEAFVSQHIGDMENVQTFDAWLHAKDIYEHLFHMQPTQLACDDHPEYLTTKWAKDASREYDLPLTEVQHHHAHIASVLGEHALNGAAIGFAFDGTGFGSDGAIWGGEVLLANTRDYERFANFAYVPMPGGAACIKNPLRMAYGVLWAYDLLRHPAAEKLLQQLGEEQCSVMEQMIEQGLNTPNTSSVGRLFDAASAILGICTKATYEGEPAILLEAAATRWTAQSNGEVSAPDYSIDITKNTANAESTAHDTSVLLLDAEPVFRGLLDDMQTGLEPEQIALKFHQAFSAAIVQTASLAQALYDLNTVVLTGGVFMNRLLIEDALEALGRQGFTIAINRELPPNDGCLSFGQAVVTLARSISEGKM